MNDSGQDVFKKSKIIEIGSVEKKVELREVGDFSKKSENPGFSYLKSVVLSPKLCLRSELTQKAVKLQKVYYSKLFLVLIRFL